MKTPTSTRPNPSIISCFCSNYLTLQRRTSVSKTTTLGSSRPELSLLGVLRKSPFPFPPYHYICVYSTHPSTIHSRCRSSIHIAITLSSNLTFPTLPLPLVSHTLTSPHTIYVEQMRHFVAPCTLVSATVPTLPTYAKSWSTGQFQGTDVVGYFCMTEN